MAWQAFDKGFNGWAYYCYYAPRGNPWDISTWSSLEYSYQMIFPGPHSPVTTPLYEEMRDGWEDYRLLHALREKGKDEFLSGILEAYRNGQPLSTLREQILNQWRN